MLQAFEETIAAVAEREQPVARRRQIAGRRQWAHGALEGGRGD
jgi:hypothetical protein